MTDTDDLYARLHVVGDKIQDLIIESGMDESIIGFALVGFIDHNGTADIRHKTDNLTFSRALIAVAGNLAQTGDI